MSFNAASIPFFINCVEKQSLIESYLKYEQNCPTNLLHFNLCITRLSFDVFNSLLVRQGSQNTTAIFPSIERSFNLKQMKWLWYLGQCASCIVVRSPTLDYFHATEYFDREWKGMNCIVEGNGGEGKGKNSWSLGQDVPKRFNWLSVSLIQCVPQKCQLQWQCNSV